MAFGKVRYLGTMSQSVVFSVQEVNGEATATTPVAELTGDRDYRCL